VGGAGEDVKRAERSAMPGPLNADQPIRDPEDDLLGVAPFAHSLAESILKMTPAKGFVMALPGEWGSGKSSILNLIERRIRHLEMAAFTIGQPYRADGTIAQLDIVEIESRARAFRRIEAVADSFSNNGQRRVSIRRPERIRAFIAAGLSASEAELAEQYSFLRSELAESPRTIVFRFNPWWFSGQDNLTRAFFDELAAVLPEADGRRARDASRALARRYSGAGATALKAAASFSGVPLLGPVIGFFAGLVSSWAGETESLSSIKSELAKALALRKHKLVVIIDDVDRLLPQEALQIFTLVKSVGDLPNVVYLLAYDQQLINDMLPRPPLNLRPDFLEKIVQYDAPVPMREPEVLPTMLLNLVNRIFPKQEEGAQEKFSRRFGTTYQFGVRPYIRQPREIARLANALDVALPALIGQVDPIDFLLLETLRLNEPNAYWAVREYLPWLTEDGVLGDDATNAAAMLQKLATCKRPDDAKIAVAQLFPRASDAWKTLSGVHKDRAGDAADRRIRTSRYARSYFGLVQPAHILNVADIEDLFSNPEPLHILQSLVTEAKQARGPKGLSRLPVLLDQIGDRLSETRPTSDALIRALVDLSEEIIRNEDADPAMFGGDNARSLEYLLRRWIATLEPSQRFDAVAPIAKHSPGLPLIAQFIRSLGPDRNPHGSHDHNSLLSDEEFGAVRDIAVARIRAIASDGQLWDVSDPAGLLWAWWAMGDDGEAQSWLAGQISDTNNALHLMAAMPTLVRSSNGNYRAVNKTSWRQLVDLDLLTARAESLSLDQSLSGEQRDAAKTFIKAMELGRH
jgi:predicted KAP-like P-loop ATPase